MEDNRVVAVDIGNVIMVGKDDLRPDGTPWDAQEDTPEVPGALESLRRLKDAGIQVHLVSFCGARVEALSRRWLEATGFRRGAGIDIHHQHYCRAPEDKALICRDRIVAAWMIDDSLRVLDACRSASIRGVWLRGDRAEAREFPDTALSSVWADTWLEAEGCVLDPASGR